MPESRTHCECFLVYYVPSALREARVVIGLFLFDASRRLVRYRIADDWRQVRCLDPGADLELLNSLPKHFGRLAQEASPEGKPLYDQLLQMQEEYSGSVEISMPHGVETENPEMEFERLFAQYVARPRPSGRRPHPREGSRPWIYARLREAIERHALWNLLAKDIAVEAFTAPGDAFRIDFGYRQNGTVKYVHALSLQRDWNQAKLLGYTLWRIRQTMDARLTAIVEVANPGLAAVPGCRKILEDAQIAIQPVSFLDPFLEEVKRELRVP